MLIWRLNWGQRIHFHECSIHGVGRRPQFLALCWLEASGPQQWPLLRTAWEFTQHSSCLPSEQVIWQRDQIGRDMFYMKESLKSTLHFNHIPFILTKALSLTHTPAHGGTGFYLLKEGVPMSMWTCIKLPYSTCLNFFICKMKINNSKVIKYCFEIKNTEVTLKRASRMVSSLYILANICFVYNYTLFTECWESLVTIIYNLYLFHHTTYLKFKFYFLSLGENLPLRFNYWYCEDKFVLLWFLPCKNWYTFSFTKMLLNLIFC